MSHDSERDFGIHTTRILKIIEAWDQTSECLDLDLDELDLSWEDIKLFIEENNMTHQGFAEVFMGGLIARETVTRAVNINIELSRLHKFLFIYALKYRMDWVEKSGSKRTAKICECCGR